MKILVLSHRFYPDVGGIEVNTEVLSAAFHSYGHHVRLLTWTKEKGNKTFPFEVVRNPHHYDLLREHSWADIVFENNLCLRLSWPRIFIKRPSVVALRTWISRADGQIAWQDRVKVKWLEHSSAVIAVSNAIRKKCWNNAVVIGNPYRSDLFKIMVATKKRPCDFVFVGRLVSDKGADLAISAFQKFLEMRLKLVKPVNGPCLTIIGDGPELESLKSLVKEASLQQHVHFEGILDGLDLVNCLNQHRFQLVPSVWEEPFGNVALEGMACGLIPIVSSGGGLPDAVGAAGLVFESGNVDSLAALMNQIYDDGIAQNRIEKKAKEHLKNHNPKIVAAKYLNVFRTALNK
ncbi:glycosyltransferase family 4 protein [Dyadobacter sp. CY326]|uniref:glycosyltransferase family 4 protein n=1 Tax=Dyadobacter sp. CY326 TaxID=2907300 RepID=UPI001F32478C|nr:glycosyltransferase family 4 protein [Dyadobacter sp. CY326]MCE7066135.1 glycosyltransferase family 4 protein [Dyadobacter sp. CY326]